MKRKHLLFLLLFALMAPWAANGQSQLNEGFESTTFPPEDWASIHVSGANYWARYTTYKHSGDASAYAHWASSGHENYLITPKLAPASDESLSFYVAAQSYSGTTLYVKVSTTTADASAFSTTLATYTTGSSGTIGTTSPSTWVEKTIDLSDYVGQQIFIAFHVVDNNGGDVIIDDVTGVTLYVASCAKPTGLAVNNGVATWNAGTASQWNLKYKKVSDETWISVNGLTAASYTFSGLDAATDYEVQVQTDCGGGDLSDWTISASFTTPCDAYDIPYTYGFEEAARFDCWTPIAGVTRQTSYVNNGSYSLKFSGTTSNMIALPQFTAATNTLRVEFWTRPESNSAPGTYSNYSGKFAVGYMTDMTDASTFVAVETYNSTEMTTSYVKKTVDFTNAPAGANIAMRQFDCATNYYWFVDDVTVKEIPSCLAPTALDADASTDAAELSWTANSNETAWTLYWKKTTDENYTEVANATNPYTLSGLTAATNYEYYVVANCSTDEASEPSEVFTFATECDVVAALGYSENFDDYEVASNYTAPSARVLPSCWNAINTTTYSTYKVFPTIYYYSSTNYANSTPNSLKFYSYAYYSSGTTSYDPQPQYAILPEMEGLAGMQVQLQARGYNATSTFKIGTMSDPTDASTFTMIAEQTLTTSYQEFEYIIPTGCTDNYLAIMIDAANSSRTTNGVYIDDIVIVEAPTCIKPTGLAVTANSITNDGATITWTAGGDETQWQIEFATDADFTHPLYETVEGEPTYTFHGLDEITKYYVHVQAVCGGSNGSSEYSATVNFTTLQTPANLPYVTDFESENGWLFVNGNLTNAWAYGEATSNGQGTHALYISNDGGTTNAYTNTSAVMVYATKLFNFEAGIYVFSYDWKANGESTYDYLRVALVPSTVTLTAGTSAPTVPSGSFYNNLPTGWIALDGGGKLNLSSDWQSYASNEIEIAAGTYMMVFAWRDDTSGGSNPPAAIDNVSIVKITCITPTGLDAPQSGITATSAELSWTENGEATAWQIELTDEEENVITIDVNEEDLVNGVYTIASLTSETVYTAKVRANCGDGFSRWSEEVIFETAADCQVSDGLAAVATSNSAEISWNGYGQEVFNLRYSAEDDETWTTLTEVTNPYTLDQLTPATTYQVQVQPICADEGTWSEAYTFHTLCESITTFPWSEGFEDGLSFCWDQDGEGTWTVGTGDGNTYTPIDAHTGTYNAMITHDESGNVTKLITPVLDLTSLNNPMLTFWYINRKWVSDIDGFAVYYRTASNAAWTLIESTEEAHDAWTEATYMLPNPSATYQIAFEMTDGYGYGVGVDDIVIEEAPTYTLTIEGVGEENWEGGNGGYYLIASPLADDVAPTAVDGMITADEGDVLTYDLYSFDQEEDLEWQNYRASAFNLVNGQGYLYASKNGTTLTFTGAPSTNGQVTLDLKGTGNWAGWNLVGNPFGQTAYLSRAFYSMQNAGDFTANTEGGSIGMLEGVFVIATEDEETLTFTTTAPGKVSQLNLNLTKGNNLMDRAIVRFDEGQQLPKLQFREGSTKVYIPQEGKDYAVVSSESMGTMPVNFKAENNGTYTLSFTSEEVSFAYLHLIDNMTGTEVDLLENPSYTFDASTTDYESRFKLVFATGNNSNDDNFAFFSNGNFIINNEGEATLQVVDVMGRIIKSENINGCASVNVNAAPGVYMIRLINGNDVKVQKVVVR